MISAEKRWRQCGSGGGLMRAVSPASDQPARRDYRDNAVARAWLKVAGDRARLPRWMRQRPVGRWGRPIAEAFMTAAALPRKQFVGHREHSTMPNYRGAG